MRPYATWLVAAAFAGAAHVHAQEPSTNAPEQAATTGAVETVEADIPLEVLSTPATSIVASNPVPAIVVAESALRDGIMDMAWDRGIAALFAEDSDQEVRNRAFAVLMATCEQTLTPDAWLAAINSGELAGRELPPGDKPFAALQAYWKARALAAANRHDEAARILEGIASAGDAAAGYDIGIAATRLRAYCLAATGNALDAARLLERVETPPPEVLMDRAAMFLHAGLPAEAANTLGRLTESSGDQTILSAARLLRARALDAMGMHTNALAELAAVQTESDTASADSRALAMAMEAFILAADGNAAQAVVVADNAVKTAESATAKLECEMELVRVLSQFAIADRTAEGTRRLVAMMPGSEAVARAVGDAADNLLAAGLYGEALAEYTLLISSFAQKTIEARAQHGRGRALMGLQRYAESAAAFIRAAELSSNDTNLQIFNTLSAAEAQRAGGFFRQAMASADACLKLSPPPATKAKAMLLRAECLAELDMAAASEAFMKIASDFPDTPERGQALLRAAQLAVTLNGSSPTDGQDKHAIELYKTASESGDSRIAASSLLGIGLVHYRAGQFEDALKSFQSAASVTNGGDAVEQAVYMSAEALLARGNEEEAVKVAQGIIDRHPDSPWFREAVFWMGRRSFNRRDNKAAVEHFRQFAQTWPRDPKADDALLFASYALFQDGLFQESIDAAMKIVSDYPDGGYADVAHFLHAEALTELLQFDAAILVYDIVLQTTENGDLRRRAMGRRGDCLFTLGSDSAVRYSESIAAYESALAHPTATLLETALQYEYKIGRSLEKAGRTDDAFNRYYNNVMLRFETAAAENHEVAQSPARVWYSRAAFAAAEILERRENWTSAAAVLERIAAGRHPGADEAVRRLERARKDRLDTRTGPINTGISP